MHAGDKTPTHIRPLDYCIQNRNSSEKRNSSTPVSKFVVWRARVAVFAAISKRAAVIVDELTVHAAINVVVP